jgi:hypothetical protein
MIREIPECKHAIIMVKKKELKLINARFFTEGLKGWFGQSERYKEG